MSLPTVLRIFFAIDLPDAVKAEVNDYLTKLKKKSRSHAIRWSKPENLHITLQFLPKVDADIIPDLIANVRDEMIRFTPLSRWYVGDIALFPSPFKPRVIVLDASPQSELAELAATVGRGVIASGYDIDERPYRAHITLGRIKHSSGVNLQFLSTVPPLTLPALTLNEIVLFRSEPQPDGSRYSVLGRIPLAKPWVVKTG